MSPTPATIEAYGKMSFNVSQSIGILGIFKGGNPPSIDAISPTVVVGISKKYTNPKTANIAVRAAGTILVNLGKSQMINIAKTTSPKNE